MKNILHFPEAVPVRTETNVYFYYLVPPDPVAGTCGSIKLPAIEKFMALAMTGMNWMAPYYGRKISEVPGGTQFLISRLADGTFLLLLPLISDRYRFTLQGGKDAEHVELVYDGGIAGIEKEYRQLPVLAAVSGSDPYALVHTLVKETAGKLKTFKLRTEKKKPDFLSCFGWCSWDAFYQDVDEKKVLYALESFRKSKIKVEFVILDDGWQSISAEEGKRLISFEADRRKFPGGLRSLISRAKKKHHIKYFGVWHALEGYWNGIVPSDLLPYKFVLARQPRVVKPRPDGTIPVQYICNFVSPEDAGKFFNDYHLTLKKEGVDLVKVDVQGLLPFYFIKDYCIREETVKAYSYGMQHSAEKYFNGNLINCMCNSSDFFFHFKTANLWRNSDDYFPAKPLADQYKHLHCNAKNAFFSSTFCYPDWDMFQSGNTGADLHAAARALSGGPVYVCDKPEEHDFTVLESFADMNGKLLQPDMPALPSPDILLEDVENDEQVLKIFNRSGMSGLLGIFNCSKAAGKTLECTVSPQDVYALPGEEFAVYSRKNKTVFTMNRAEKRSLELPYGSFDILTFSPVKNGIAPIGVDGKYIPPAIFQAIRYRKNTLEVKVRCGGTILFYADTKPLAVRKDSENIPFIFRNHLVRVKVRSKEAFTLAVTVNQ